MKNYPKFIALLLITSIFIFSVSFCGNSIIISDDTMPVITENSSRYTYGIFTEEYNIQYVKDKNGNIIINKEDFEELRRLSNDAVSITKILNDKALANKANSTPSTPTISQTINNLKNLDVNKLDSDRVVINATTSDNSVDNLTNFTSDISITNAYPIEEDGFILRIRYRWWWNYEPLYTFADKVLIGWSDEFDNFYNETLSDGTVLQTRFNYYQTGYPICYDDELDMFYLDKSSPYKHTALALKGNEAFTSVSPSYGFEKKFDIKNTFTYNDTTYDVFRHSGSMYVSVGRGTAEGFDKSFNYCGTYLHKTVNLGEASASFTPGDGFSLGTVAEVLYDKAKDAAGTIKYSDIISMLQ